MAMQDVIDNAPDDMRSAITPAICDPAKGGVPDVWLQT